MLTKLIVLAAASSMDPEAAMLHERPSVLFGMSLKDILLIGGVAAVLALILFLWVYITRKDRRASSSRLSRPIYRAEKKPVTDGSVNRVKVRKRRRRNHPDHLPRNPTLAEAGGLPPLREEPPQSIA